MIKNLFKLIVCILLISNPLLAQNKSFQEGVILFQEKKFQEAKFKFEQEIVINPKSELSYLYLSEIFKNLDKKKTTREQLKYCNFTQS